MSLTDLIEECYWTDNVDNPFDLLLKYPSFNKKVSLKRRDNA